MNNPEIKEVVQRIEHIRKLNNMTKTAFSKRLGITPQTYSNYTCKQSSAPNLEFILRVCIQFKVQSEWLFTGIPPILKEE